MLITELSLTHKKALARELRKIIEPNKAQSEEVLRETEIRKYLSTCNLTYYGISDIIAILNANYTDKTVSRLTSKIQKPIVWDTCICNISSQELTDLLYNKNVDSIITTAVFDELIKLAISSDSSKTGITNAFKLVEDILEDTDSKFCTIVDLPKDTCVNNYVDNQLLWYCSKNDYELYTHDYVLGLRCKLNQINVKIFTSFSNTIPYIPNPDGKNIILHCDLIDTVPDILPVYDITNTATDLSANKFVLTRKFIDTLEGKQCKKNNMELVQFLVNDIENQYTIFADDEEGTDLATLAKKYNAIILTSDIKQCIEYKKNYIPYSLVRPSKDSSFKNRLHRALIFSPYYKYDFDYDDNLDENNIETDKNDESNSAENAITVSNTGNNAETITSETDKPITNPVDENDNTSSKSDDTANVTTTEKANSKFVPSNALVPHYKPRTHQILVKQLPLNETMWVLNANGEELTPDFKTGYPVFKNFTVIHIYNNLKGTFKLSVYKILNNNTKKYGQKIMSIFFTAENVTTEIPKEYLSFAKRALILS